MLTVPLPQEAGEETWVGERPPDLPPTTEMSSRATPVVGTDERDSHAGAAVGQQKDKLSEAQIGDASTGTVGRVMGGFGSRGGQLQMAEAAKAVWQAKVAKTEQDLQESIARRNWCEKELQAAMRGEVSSDTGSSDDDGYSGPGFAEARRSRRARNADRARRRAVLIGYQAGTAGGAACGTEHVTSPPSSSSIEVRRYTLLDGGHEGGSEAERPMRTADDEPPPMKFVRLNALAGYPSAAVHVVLEGTDEDEPPPLETAWSQASETSNRHGSSSDTESWDGEPWRKWLEFSPYSPQQPPGEPGFQGSESDVNSSAEDGSTTDRGGSQGAESGDCALELASYLQQTCIEPGGCLGEGDHWWEDFGWQAKDPEVLNLT